MLQRFAFNATSDAAMILNSISPHGVNNTLQNNLEEKLAGLPEYSLPRRLWAKFGPKHPVVDTVSTIKRLSRCEQRWQRTRDNAKSLESSEGSIVYSVVGLITVGKDNAWGRKMPKPRFAWTTPVKQGKITTRRDSVRLTKALLSHDELMSLFEKHYLRTYEPVSIRDAAAGVQAQDFPFLPEGADTLVPAYCYADPSGDTYGRFFIVPLRPDWLDQGRRKSTAIELRQSDLANSLYEALKQRN